MQNVISNKTIIFKITFIVYLILLVWIIALKCNFKNVIDDTYYSFKDIDLIYRFSLAFEMFNFSYSDFYLNILIFIPLGIYVSFFNKKINLIKIIGISFFVSFVFETIQLFTLIGCCSIEDLITNVSGGIIGYYIFIFLNKYKNNMKLYYIIQISLLIVFVPIMFYAIYNTIINIDYYIDILCRNR